MGDDESDDDLLPVNGGLVLPSNVGLGESIVRRTGKRWDTLAEVEDELKKLKVPELVEPDVNCPEITAQILLTPDGKEYTTIFAHTRRWYGYAGRLLARSRAALLEVQNQLTNLEAEIRKNIRSKAKTMPKADRPGVEQIGDEVKTDPHWQELKLREQRLEQYKLELAAWFEDLERMLRLVSRQVELRKEDFEGGRNEQNMPGRQRGGFSPAPRQR